MNFITLILRRWLVLAVVCISAFSLTAQTYYRVHKDEFDFLTKYLDGTWQNYLSFVIVSPENEVAVCSEKLNSSRTYLNQVEVLVSDDLETVKLPNNSNNVNFNINKKEGSSELYYISDVTSTYRLGVTKSSEIYKFEYFSDTETVPTTSSADFKMLFDNYDDGCVQLKSGLKNTDLYIGCSKTEDGGKDVFKLLSDDTPLLSIYRLDYFDWTVDNSKVADNGIVTVKGVPSEEIKEFASYIDIHYILNDGEEVSITDLMNSQNVLRDIRIDKGDEFMVEIPVKETVSRLNDDNNTIWILPVADETLPLGKVVSATYGEDDIITGVMIAAEDAETQEAVYYTLDGRKAAMPLMPGVYVRRIGDKADKVIIR